MIPSLFLKNKCSSSVVKTIFKLTFPNTQDDFVWLIFSILLRQSHLVNALFELINLCDLFSTDNLLTFV